MLICEPGHSTRLKRVYGRMVPTTHTLPNLLNFLESDNPFLKPCHMRASPTLEKGSVYYVFSYLQRWSIQLMLSKALTKRLIQHHTHTAAPFPFTDWTGTILGSLGAFPECCQIATSLVTVAANKTYGHTQTLLVLSPTSSVSSRMGWIKTFSFSQDQTLTFIHFSLLNLLRDWKLLTQGRTVFGSNNH